jgi:hypothetical protein
MIRQNPKIPAAMPLQIGTSLLISNHLDTQWMIAALVDRIPGLGSGSPDLRETLQFVVERSLKAPLE